MKIFDKMGNEHESVVEALEAEKAYDEMVAEEAARKEKAKAERATRAKEVEDAFKEAAAANKNWIDLLNAFVKDYGSYHQTIRDTNIDGFDRALFRDLFDTILRF